MVLTRRFMGHLAGAAALVAITARPAMAAAHSRHAYGPDPRQTLTLYGSAARAGPWVVLVGPRGSGERTIVSMLRRRGLAVAVVERRSGRFGLAGPAGDVARAIGWLYAHAKVSNLALWGQGDGAEACLMMVRDRRYLQAQNMSPDQIAGMVLAGSERTEEPTFTMARAYGLAEPSAVFRIGEGQAAEGTAFLSGLL